jgi:hypothetical protein
MEPRYLNRLPADSQLLVAQIEGEAHREIVVRTERRGRRGLACYVLDAEIVLPEENYFPEDSSLHELLHLRRFYVNKAPVLDLCEDFAETIDPEQENQIKEYLKNIDNGLEHLVIVPEELSRYPDRQAYWDGVMERALNQIRLARLTDQERESHALINWAFVSRVVRSKDVIEQGRALIEEFALDERADRFVDLLVPALQLKEQIVSVCMAERLCFPPGTCLEYVGGRQVCIPFSSE